MAHEVRLQLHLAKSGVASRRRAESLIVAGEVTVNGKVVTQLGTKINPAFDKVAVRGKELAAEAPAYVLFNKPKGYVTTANDPEGRPTIFTLLGDLGVRLFSVGRLDFNTEGALLLTNDGELAHVLMHPRHEVDKVYQAKLRGRVSQSQIQSLRDGVILPPLRQESQEGPIPPRFQTARKGPEEKRERSAPAQVKVLSETRTNTWLEITLHEGKNRQIHRMAAAIGSSLLKLVRVRYSTLSVEDLPVGQFRPLRPREITELRATAGLLPHEGKEARAAEGMLVKLRQAGQKRQSSFPMEPPSDPRRPWAPNRPSDSRRSSAGPQRSPESRWQREPRRAESREPRRAESREPRRAESREPRRAESREPRSPHRSARPSVPR